MWRITLSRAGFLYQNPPPYPRSQRSIILPISEANTPFSTVMFCQSTYSLVVQVHTFLSIYIFSLLSSTSTTLAMEHPLRLPLQYRYPYPRLLTPIIFITGKHTREYTKFASTYPNLSQASRRIQIYTPTKGKKS